MTKPRDIDEYIAGFPSEVQHLLEQLRATIRSAAPDAVEVISYGMPGFKWNGMLVWFAAYKNHIGFYPKKSGITAFQEQLSAYKGAKGSVQFPLNQPLPVELIAQIIHFRLLENGQRVKKR